MSLRVRPETGDDAEAIRKVHLAAFPTAAEADLVRMLHEDFDSEISLVAEAADGVVGHVMLSRMAAEGDGRPYRALGLGPVAVHPGRQRQSVPVKAVVFDVGNVLYGWDPDSFLTRQLPDDAARMRFIDDIGLWEWHDTLDGGRPFREAADELSLKFPEYAHLIEAWSDRFGETITGPVPGVHAIVEALDAKRVPLFAITNFSADFWAPFHAQERAFFDRFQGIVVSGEEKMLKPDPAIYYLALDRFRLRPAEALFIDDRAINVAGAEAVGMKAHLFTGAEDLRARLEAEGLL